MPCSSDLKHRLLSASSFVPQHQCDVSLRGVGYRRVLSIQNWVMYMEVSTQLMATVYNPLSQTETLLSFDLRKQACALGLRTGFSLLGFHFLPPLKVALCSQVCLAVPLYDINH